MPRPAWSRRPGRPQQGACTVSFPGIPSVPSPRPDGPDRRPGHLAAASSFRPRARARFAMVDAPMEGRHLPSSCVAVRVSLGLVLAGLGAGCATSPSKPAAATGSDSSRFMAFPAVTADGKSAGTLQLGQTTLAEAKQMLPPPPADVAQGQPRTPDGYPRPTRGEVIPKPTLVYNPWKTSYQLFFDANQRLVALVDGGIRLPRQAGRDGREAVPGPPRDGARAAVLRAAGAGRSLRHDAGDGLDQRHHRQRRGVRLPLRDDEGALIPLRAGTVASGERTRRGPTRPTAGPRSRRSRGPTSGSRACRAPPRS